MKLKYKKLISIDSKLLWFSRNFHKNPSPKT